MKPTKLTHSERLSLSRTLREELATEDSSGVELEFDNFSDISVVLEYDSVDASIVFSFKIDNISAKVPYGFIGCPSHLGDIETVGVRNICTELETVLENEFGWVTTISNASFTVYDWSCDTAWYLYETEVNSE